MTHDVITILRTIKKTYESRRLRFLYQNLNKSRLFNLPRRDSSQIKIRIYASYGSWFPSRTYSKLWH